MALCAHFKKCYGGAIRCDRVRRVFHILSTDIQVVTNHEYELKCKCGFRGKIATEEEIWKTLEKEKQKHDSSPDESSGS